MKKGILDNILALKSPNEIMLTIAENVKQRRLEKNLTQKIFAQQTGINFATYRRFETSGEISLRNLANIAIALNAGKELSALFTSSAYNSINEMLTAKTNKERKRARSK